MANVSDAVSEKLAKVTEALATKLDADVLGIFGAILRLLSGAHSLRSAGELVVSLVPPSPPRPGSTAWLFLGRHAACHSRKENAVAPAAAVAAARWKPAELSLDAACEGRYEPRGAGAEDGDDRERPGCEVRALAAIDWQTGITAESRSLA